MAISGQRSAVSKEERESEEMAISGQRSAVGKEGWERIFLLPIGEMLIFVGWVEQGAIGDPHDR